ncbi:MAG: phosphohistidine phosphatase SixA [Elusimicrobiota bacterium]|jgi:phosphohistidine phosphatase
MKMLNVYLMRHAEAASIGGEVHRDKDRPLTPHGRLQVEAVAVALQKRAGTVSVIVSSPALRAVQTAHFLAERLSVTDIQTSLHLAPRGRAPLIDDLLKQPESVRGIILIGHQPDLGLLASHWSGHDVGFRTAALAAFEWEPGGAQATYRWTFSPDD